MASKTIYSHDLRLLVCSNCGAPLEASLAGGVVQCDYCRASHHVEGRDERRDLQQAQQASRFSSEAERMRHLRTQDNRPRRLPAEVMRLVRQGRIVDTARDEAQRQWMTWRQQVQAAGGEVIEERFFHLSLLLGRTYESRRSRAVLEDAVELCAVPRHRHILRCEVARDAARIGDTEAARDWLKVCVERPDDLEMDSAYRIAAAHVAISERRLGEVATLVGAEGGDIPVHDAYDAEAALLRAHAREMAGDISGAASQLELDMLREPRLIEAMQEVVNRDTGASLCPHSFPRAFERAWDQVRAALRPPGIPSLLPILGLWIPVLLGGAIVVLAITGSLGSHPAIVVNAIVHPLIWLVLLPLMFATALSRRRKSVKSLIKHGVYTYARVGAVGGAMGGMPRMAPPTPGAIGNAPLVVDAASSTAGAIGNTTVLVEVLLDDRIISTTATTALLSGPIAPGAYPCFIDPRRPETVKVQFAPMAPAPFRQAFAH